MRLARHENLFTLMWHLHLVKNENPGGNMPDYQPGHPAYTECGHGPVTCHANRCFRSGGDAKYTWSIDSALYCARECDPLNSRTLDAFRYLYTVIESNDISAIKDIASSLLSDLEG